MRVHIERALMLDEFHIYVSDRGPGGTYSALLPGEGHRLEWRVVDPSSEPEPTLRLQEDILAAIVASATEYLPPSATMQVALDDTRTVRDRLLSMIEKRWETE